MGRLIIDGNSIFEIDEECVKQRQIPNDCDIKKYIQNYATEDCGVYKEQNKNSLKKATE